MRRTARSGPLALATALGLSQGSYASLSSCLTEADVPFLMDNSSGWDDAIAPYNSRLSPVPAAYVNATTVEHVQDAVKCAAQHDYKVSPKSGGHSYAAYGLGGDDGNVVVSVDGMWGVTLHEDNTATVLPGSRLGHVATQLFEGNRAMSHGTCPGVGFAGHVLHGGYGFSSHAHGLSLDAMIGAKVVLADGSIVRASRDENPDLFWSLRGAGSSFGIVVEFQVDTFEAPESMTWMTPSINWDLEDSDAVLKGLLAWQDFAENTATSEVNARMSISSILGYKLEIVYHGPEDEARQLFEVLDEPLKLNWTGAVNTGGWMDQLQAFNDRPDLAFNLTGPYDTQANQYASSLVTARISEDAMRSFVNFFLSESAQSRMSWLVQMDLHGGDNSAIAAMPHDATAYPHRDKLWLFQFLEFVIDEDDKSPDEERIAFVNGLVDSIKDEMNAGDWGRYANYVDSELAHNEAVVQYYGDHLSQLREIKARLDPKDVFHYPQSIEPTEGV